MNQSNKKSLLHLFYHKIDSHTYLYEKNDYIDPDNLGEQKEIRIPLVIDTEFYQGVGTRKGVTVQIKGIFNEPKIFAHRDLEAYADGHNLRLRHTVARSNFAPIDYLRSMGVDARLQVRETTGKPSDKMPVIQFDLYAHFALAELLLIFNDDARKKIENILVSKNSNKKIELQRRLRTYTKVKNDSECDFINLPCFTIINGKKYKTRLRIIDTCALHGVASYKDLAENTGIQLKYKDNLSQDEKENMAQTYFNNPDKFDEYALGDLEVYNFLESNSKLFYKVHESLDIAEFFTPPKLTIGSTVARLFESVLFKKLGLNDEKSQEKLKEMLRDGASPKKLKTNTDETACLLSKVFGGRCRNNRPLDVFETLKTLVDADKLSAYGTALYNQDYPIGYPIIESFKVAKNNHYPTLREWLTARKYGTSDYELVDNLWIAIVSNRQGYILKHPQDYLASWFDFKFKDIAKMLTDSDECDSEFNPKTGKVKILNNEITNAVITSDFIEWLYHTCNPKQRTELLDNLQIQASCYYPSYSKVDSYAELLEKCQEWDEENTLVSEQNGKKKTGKVTSITNVKSYWTSFNLGELLIQNLLAYRQFYKLRDGKKCSLQTLFKLIVNTLYGDFTSPFFNCSNTVVGNNITAKVRGMAWCLEKALNGHETVTDGVQFDANRVVFPIEENRRITASNVVNLYQEKSDRDMRINRQLTLKPLGGYYKIEHFYDGECSDSEKKKIKLKLYSDEENYTVIDDSASWFNNAIIDHLKTMFPNLSIFKNTYHAVVINKEKSLEENKPVVEYIDRIGLFQIEIKDIYDSGVFHGTANYLLSNENETIPKMRSYEAKKKHYTYDQDIQPTEFYSEEITPSVYFLNELKHPESVRRSKAFKKLGILKTKDFRNNPEKYIGMGFFCGDSIEKAGLLREFSGSMFTFKTKKQLIAIEKEMMRNKRRFDQSYEGYFINDDGTLNYREMIETIDMMIQKGLHSFNNYLDKHHNRHRSKFMNHPDKEIYRFLKDNVIGVRKNHDDYIDELIEYDDSIELELDDIEIDF